MNSKTKIKNINRRINKIAKKVKKIKKRRLLNKRQPRFIIRNRRRRRRALPAAFTKSFKREFNILRQTGTSMRVKGRDLIYKIPTNLQSNNNTDIITVIPCNPAYWLGTRMAAISAGYQNYRPILFKITYVPQCAVTQQGNVIGGTIWNMSPNDANIQQTLRTSNGGMLTQCYKTFTANIELGTNLQFNLFRMGGKFDQESNPFIYLAMSIGTKDSNNNTIIPGYFYVNYEYELKNPIGDTIKYYNSGLIQNKEKPTIYINQSLINCSDQKCNIGALIQNDQGYTWNDKNIDINPDSYVWYFCNQIKSDLDIEEPLELIIPQSILGQQLISLPLQNGDNYFLNDLGDSVYSLIKVSATQEYMALPINLIAQQGNLYRIIQDNYDLWIGEQDLEMISTFQSYTLVDNTTITVNIYTNTNSHLIIEE